MAGILKPHLCLFEFLSISINHEEHPDFYHEEHEDHEDFLNIIFVIFVFFVVKIRVFFVVNILSLWLFQHWGELRRIGFLFSAGEKSLFQSLSKFQRGLLDQEVRSQPCYNDKDDVNRELGDY